MNWLLYLVEANIYLCVFYLFYCLFLTKETHYLLNRVYLLASCIVSFVIPVMQLGFLVEPAAVQASYTIKSIPSNFPKVVSIRPVEAPHFTFQDGLVAIYLLGVTLSFMLLIIKLYRLFKLSRQYQTSQNGNFKLVLLQDTETAFSFLNYLFVDAGTSRNEMIIRHELVHIRQKHSFDILLLELLKVISWFNPMLYLMQKSLKTLHEYIADEQTAINGTDRLAYTSFLVSNAYGITDSPITHSFFNYNLLKKRIIMLNQQRSGSLARLKYLVALPICAVLLCASTLAFSKTYRWVDLAPNKSTQPSSPNNLHTRKTLKLVNSDTVAYGDEMTIHEKTYRANTFTRKDAASLVKNYRLNIKVVKTNTRPGAVTVFIPTPSKSPVVNQEMPSPDQLKAGVTKKEIAVPTDSLPGHEFYPLYEKLQRTIHYPTIAVENKINGKVFASFTVDADHKIQAVAILRGPSAVIDQEVLRAIKRISVVPAAKPGVNYTVPINFIIDGYNGPATVDKNPVKIGDVLSPSNIHLELDEVVIIIYGKQ